MTPLAAPLQHLLAASRLMRPLLLPRLSTASSVHAMTLAVMAMVGAASLSKYTMVAKVLLHLFGTRPPASLFLALPSLNLPASPALTPDHPRVFDAVPAEDPPLQGTKPHRRLPSTPPF